MNRGRRLVPDDALPDWLRPLVGRLDGAALTDVVRAQLPVTPPDARRSAVLILLGDGSGGPGGPGGPGGQQGAEGRAGRAGPVGSGGPDVLLTGRASTMRSHAGQPAFPGGAQDPGESPIEAALREAQEETGLEPSGVLPVATMPDLYLGASSYVVTPVLGYWHTPGAVWPVDPAETEVVVRVPLAVLADPARRGRVRHSSGYIGPAFDVADLVVWGFTAGLLDAVLRLGGWQRPWNPGRFLTLPELGAALPDPEAGHLGDEQADPEPGRTRVG